MGEWTSSSPARDNGLIEWIVPFEFEIGRFWWQPNAMGNGRLIRVSRYRGDEKAVAYIVAIT